MTANKKAPGEPVQTATSEIVDGMETLTRVFTAGFERSAEIRKQTVDFVAQQNVAVVDAWKKMSFGLPIPGLYFLDLMASTFDRYAEIEKEEMDLAVKNVQDFASLFQERNIAAGKVVERATKMVQDSVDRSVAVHKKVLDSTAEHTKGVFEKTKESFGSTGGRAEALATSFHRGVDAIVETQKDLLDIAATPIHNVH